LSEEIIDVKRNCRYLFLISILLLFCIPFATAQGSATISMGFGTNHVKSNGAGINELTGDVCSPALDNPDCLTNPGLNGFFMGFGADMLPSKRYGFGLDISFQPTKGDYGPLKFRQTFYDFNGIYAPVNQKRVVVKLKGGIGGAKTSLSLNQTSCIGSIICQSDTYSLGSANHFQLHVGAGVEIYATKNVFLRPEFNFRHITNFTEEFGRNNVVGGMLWLGVRTSGR
jgi:opacity protein-like surface antigen